MKADQTIRCSNVRYLPKSKRVAKMAEILELEQALLAIRFQDFCVRSRTEAFWAWATSSP